MDALGLLLLATLQVAAPTHLAGSPAALISTPSGADGDSQIPLAPGDRGWRGYSARYRRAVQSAEDKDASLVRGEEDSIAAARNRTDRRHPNMPRMRNSSMPASPGRRRMRPPSMENNSTTSESSSSEHAMHMRPPSNGMPKGRHPSPPDTEGESKQNDVESEAPSMEERGQRPSSMAAPSGRKRMRPPSMQNNSTTSESSSSEHAMHMRPPSKGMPKGRQHPPPDMEGESKQNDVESEAPSMEERGQRPSSMAAPSGRKRMRPPSMQDNSTTSESSSSEHAMHMRPPPMGMPKGRQHPPPDMEGESEEDDDESEAANMEGRGQQPDSMAAPSGRRQMRPPPMEKHSTRSSSTTSESDSSERAMHMRPPSRGRPRGRPPPPPEWEGESEEDDDEQEAPSKERRGRRPPPRQGRKTMMPSSDSQAEAGQASQAMMMRRRGRRDVDEDILSSSGAAPEAENRADAENEVDTEVKNRSLASGGRRRHDGAVPEKAGCFGYRRAYPVFVPVPVPAPPPPDDGGDDGDAEQLQRIRAPRMRTRSNRARGRRSTEGVEGAEETVAGLVRERRAASSQSEASSSSSSSAGWSSRTSAKGNGGASAVATASVRDGNGHVKTVRSEDVHLSGRSGGGSASASARVSTRAAARQSPRAGAAARSQRASRRGLVSEQEDQQVPLGSADLTQQLPVNYHDALESSVVDNSADLSALDAPAERGTLITDYLQRSRSKREAPAINQDDHDDTINTLEGEDADQGSSLSDSIRELVKRCVGAYTQGNGGGNAGAEVAKEGIRAGRAAIDGGVQVAKLLVQAFRDLGSSSRRKRDVMENVKKNMKDKMETAMSRVNERVMNANEKMDDKFGDNPIYAKGKEQIMEGLGTVIQTAIKLSTSSGDDSSRRRRDTEGATEPKPKRGKEAILARIYADMDNMPGRRRAKMVREREELADPDPEPNSSEEVESPLRAKRHVQVGEPEATSTEAATTALPEPDGAAAPQEDAAEEEENVNEAVVPRDLAAELGLRRRKRDIVDDLKQMRETVLQKGRELMELAKQAISRAINRSQDQGRDSPDDDAFSRDVESDNKMDSKSTQGDRASDESMPGASQLPGEDHSGENNGMDNMPPMDKSGEMAGTEAEDMQSSTMKEHTQKQSNTTTKREKLNNDPTVRPMGQDSTTSVPEHSTIIHQDQNSTGDDQDNGKKNESGADLEHSRKDERSMLSEIGAN